MKVFSGIEGGASRTRCVIGDETGKLLGVGYGGPSNYLTVSMETVKKSLREALDGALKVCGVSRSLEGAYVGLAGIGLLHQPLILENTVQKVTGSKKTFINNDGYVAMQGAFAGGPGIILVSGTGSIAMGSNENGKVARVGGWGHILGDEGSGFHLGLEGVRAVTRAHDYLLPSTELTEKALSFFGAERVEELVRVFYLDGVGKERLAAFSEEVLAAASRGDGVAIELVASECKALKQMVRVLRARLSLDTPRLALFGGVFEGSQWFTNRFIEELGDEAEVVEPQFSPVTGAFMLALTTSCIKLTPEIIENIRESENALLRQSRR